MASGDTLLIFTPASNEPPDSSYATFDVRGSGHPVIDFDESADESAVFTGVMPDHYDGGGVTVYLTGSWTSDTNGAHTTQMEVSFERIGDAQQDVDTDGFASARDVTLTVDSTSGKTDVASVVFSDGAQIDNVAAGELFRLKVICDTSDSDHSGDFELHSVKLTET
jgi:hypothetical protein